MAYVSKQWTDFDYQYPTRYTLWHEDLSSEVITLENNFGQERVTGDSWEASVMNAMEGRISAAFDDAEETRDGSTVPTAAIGKDGDFYVQTETVSNVTSVVALFVRVDGAWHEIPYQRPPVEVTGTLTAGSTTITLQDASILTTSTIDIYTDAWGVNPETVVVTTGQIVMTFEAQVADLGVKVVIK